MNSQTPLFSNVMRVFLKNFFIWILHKKVKQKWILVNFLSVFFILNDTSCWFFGVKLSYLESDAESFITKYRKFLVESIAQNHYFSMQVNDIQTEMQNVIE